MSSDNTFSCFLIGADSLLSECGEVLLSKGHTIHGVITSAPKISEWARSKSLTVIPEKPSYIEALQNQSFDYLFSITHLAIIKDDVLALPRKMAINFHDGPLPAYAGLNTPAWALMNQESKYGISWHQIIAGVDKGDILKQSFFDVAPRETSLSINTNCFAAALESFPLLIDELVAGTQHAVAQDFSKRSIFGKFDRPAAAGLLDWSKSSVELDALVRALDFGDYANLLNTPKIRIGDTVINVTAAVAREAQSEKAPGTILQLEEGQIDVSCGEGVLALTGFKNEANKTLSPGEVANQFALQANTVLASVSTEDAERLSEVNRKLAKKDEFWAKQLAYLEPVELPYCQQDADSAFPNGSLAEQVIDLPAGVNREVFVSALAILLARINRKDEFDLAFADSAIHADAASGKGIFNTYAALHLGVNTKDSASAIIQHTQASMAKVSESGAWAKDLIIRTPQLAANPELCAGSALPVAVNIGQHEALPGAMITVCFDEAQSTAQLVYKAQFLSEAKASMFVNQLAAVLTALSANANIAANEIELLTQAEKQTLLEQWNATKVSYDNSQCIHHLFEQRVAQHPNATALVFENESVTYVELNTLANQLAHHLIEKGVQPDDMVGVNVNRSVDLMVATLGVHKAGAAYVPLDPAFPSDRIAYMVADAKMRLVITQESILADLPASDAEVILVDQFTDASKETANPQIDMDSAKLAYVIYTSGSTGNPKGVMVEHRNATNFFVGMDERIEHDVPGTWLAVTSLSFDISVLELFWTLTRGFKVVIYREDRGKQESRRIRKIQGRAMEFGLFMWGNDDGPGADKYKLMLEGSKYFDENGFDSVWTPERHFSAFGGPYPNPAVTSAAIAAVTKRIAIRSGSIVSPLHHPVRIAEDWAVVDNLSNGRVGLSFAAGWQPNDFIIMPQNHKNNKKVMLEQIDTVKRLWRGEKVEFESPMGTMVPTETLPRPVQKELPVWLTTAGNPESYRQAGAMGVNVLTHLLGQSVEELTEKVRIYRKAREEAGFDPATGKISLMLHAFVGENDDEVRELVREPMKDYLRSAMKLVLDFAWSFPAFKRPGGQEAKPDDIDIKSLSEEESETILDFAFDRYYETSGLFGTPETCAKMIDRCKGADINEIACLLDFGVETQKVMDGLPLLKHVRDMANVGLASDEDQELDQSWAAQVERHQVTHFQCTPSMARMLGFDEEARKQFPKLKHMMVGGEAFPNTLAKDMNGLLTGRLTNMYGPTETTIWSTTQDVTDPDNIPIGRPIANTDIYILDENHQPVPIGVPGDLFIGGQGVVRGYLHRPELTAERFIDNPIKNDGSRIYWTGDLAKYREDGVIEFLGRIDHQVKIRGYRIELGEIEARLGSHESVSDCVLLLREDSPGDQRLVAYVVPQGLAADANTLRDYLRKDLPEYMVPNDVVTLDAMPLTPNGKLDRKQLPIPSAGGAQAASADYEAPENELQQIIVNVWQDTLKLDKIGVRDNFFDLGGHSLLIVRVHQLLKERVEKPISLTDLYRFPTIKSLTDFLNSDDDGESLKKSSDRASRRRERLGLRKRGR